MNSAGHTNRMFRVLQSSDKLIIKTDLSDESGSTTQLSLICHNVLGLVNCDMQSTMEQVTRHGLSLSTPTTLSTTTARSTFDPPGCFYLHKTPQISKYMQSEAPCSTQNIVDHVKHEDL